MLGLHPQQQQLQVSASSWAQQAEALTIPVAAGPWVLRMKLTAAFLILGRSRCSSCLHQRMSPVLIEPVLKSSSFTVDITVKTFNNNKNKQINSQVFVFYSYTLT